MHSGISGQILQTAARCVADIEREAVTLDDCVDAPEVKEIRRSLEHLLYAYFRHKKFVDTVLANYCPRPPHPRTRTLLAIAITQMRYQSAIAPQSAANVAVESARRQEKGFINAILRRFLRENPTEKSAPEDVFPDLVLSRWKSRFSATEISSLVAATHDEPKFTFRAVNGAIPEFPAEKCQAHGDFACYVADAATVLASQQFQNGEFYVQDVSATLAPSLGNPSKATKLLDACAAPGGKSLALAERMSEGARLLANDVSERRQQLTQANVRLRHLEDKITVSSSKLSQIRGKFGYILIDAPCSNTGVFRRRPDALWRFSLPELRQITTIQRQLLDDAASLLDSHGELVYSTCSIEAEEDGDMVAAFLARHREFVLAAEQLVLPSTAADGAYAALLVKK